MIKDLLSTIVILVSFASFFQGGGGGGGLEDRKELCEIKNNFCASAM